ncbi:hypothetical protein HPP92_026891 [Vanilla planifolia]|uniref:GDSL esterase/lipase n=1 Tax=Vanilla planifolia TaxID=51239 RepID=A0A835PDE7_VANPL|nr:hypothetical protein HPP92_026891 [Vanilla planifolia]
MAFMSAKVPSLVRLVFYTLSSATFLFAAGTGAAGVPAIYVFGDSTADVGNNNYLTGKAARANFPHNGIDFPEQRPTGRFSNGYNGIDFLAIHLGFRRSPPPFLSIASKFNHRIARGTEGVNFASGDQEFWTPRSLFLISTGGNDIFGFFSQNLAPNNTEKERFINTLISTYEYHLQKLYGMGARRFGIVDVPPIGCCPFPRSLNPTEGCVDLLNELALQFNEATKIFMSDLSLKLKGMKYSIGSSYALVSNIIHNPSPLGFKETRTACCGAGKFNGESACTPDVACCTERNRYLFWDMLHPTHAASKLAGLAIYNGSLEFASPVNFKQLAEELY